MRSMESSYQKFLKDQVIEYDLLNKKDTHLFTHVEMATYFFMRCVDLYLKTGGLISFILPISVLGPAGQHKKFQRFSKPLIHITHIYNFEEISGVFSLPFCVLFGIKGKHTQYPLREVRFSSKVGGYRRNERLQRIESSLALKEIQYSPPVEPSNHSFYIEHIKPGASIYPRPFWFVEFNTATLGFDVHNPPVISSDEVRRVAKDNWKVAIDGEVESEYFFLTLEGKDLIPFGLVKFRPIVLPCQIKQTGLHLDDIDGLRVKGKYHMAEWLSKVQKEWEKGREKKSAILFPRVINRLDEFNQLSNQNPILRYVVMYNARGANAMAYVLDRSCVPRLSITKEVGIDNVFFVMDYTSYYFYTNDANEAHYLCAVLNSSVSNKRVKPFQPRGKYGKRDIGKRLFMLPIPKYDSRIQTHVGLAKLSKDCHDIVAEYHFVKTGFKSMRNEALKILSKKISEIDTAVIEIVK